MVEAFRTANSQLTTGGSAVSSFRQILAALVMLGMTMIGPKAQAQPCSTGDQFADQVQILDSFDFANNGGTSRGGSYTAPVSKGSLKTLISKPPSSYLGTIYQQYHDDIAAAFDAAPLYLKVALCSLERQVIKGKVVPGVFIDPEDQAPFAWSFWEVSGQGAGSGRYVAVGAKAWRIHPSLNLSSLEELLLTDLLGENAVGSLFSTPQVNPASSEIYGTGQGSPTNLALMAMLAREVGLIMYHDHVDATASRGPLPNICTNSNGSNAPFQSYSWNVKTMPTSSGRIQKLGEEINSATAEWKNKQAYVMPSTIRQNVNQAPPGNNATQINQFKSIYMGVQATNNLPEWADLLSVATPYDDFAETFRLMALHDSVAGTNTPSLIDVTITLLNSDNLGLISRFPQTIPAKPDPATSLLIQKASCIASNVGTASNIGPWAANP